MVTKTLTITQEAYDALKRRKRGDMSFSDVIVELDKQKMRGSLLRLVGLLSKDQAEEMRTMLKQNRELDIERQKKRLHGWS